MQHHDVEIKSNFLKSDGKTVQVQVTVVPCARLEKEEQILIFRKIS